MYLNIIYFDWKLHSGNRFLLFSGVGVCRAQPTQAPPPPESATDENH